MDRPDPDDDGPLHWKTRTLTTVAAGRPIVRVDDEIGAVDRDWVSAQHDGAALLHRVDPRRSLTGDDIADIRDRVERDQDGLSPGGALSHE